MESVWVQYSLRSACQSEVKTAMEVLRASGGVYLEGPAGCGKTSFLIGTVLVFFGSSADEVKYLVVTADTTGQCFLLGAG